MPCQLDELAGERWGPKEQAPSRRSRWRKKLQVWNVCHLYNFRVKLQVHFQIHQFGKTSKSSSIFSMASLSSQILPIWPCACKTASPVIRAASFGVAGELMTHFLRFWMSKSCSAWPAGNVATKRQYGSGTNAWISTWEKGPIRNFFFGGPEIFLEF